MEQITHAIVTAKSSRRRSSSNALPRCASVDSVSSTVDDTSDAVEDTTDALGDTVDGLLGGND